MKFPFEDNNLFTDVKVKKKQSNTPLFLEDNYSSSLLEFIYNKSSGLPVCEMIYVDSNVDNNFNDNWDTFSLSTKTKRILVNRNFSNFNYVNNYVINKINDYSNSSIYEYSDENSIMEKINLFYYLIISETMIRNHVKYMLVSSYNYRKYSLYQLTDVKPIFCNIDDIIIFYKPSSSNDNGSINYVKYDNRWEVVFLIDNNYGNYFKKIKIINEN